MNHEAFRFGPFDAAELSFDAMLQDLESVVEAAGTAVQGPLAIVPSGALLSVTDRKP